MGMALSGAVAPKLAERTRDGRADHAIAAQKVGLAALGLLPEKRQLRLAIWRYSYVYVGVVLQDREYGVEGAAQGRRLHPTHCTAERCAARLCCVVVAEKLSVVADQHSPLIVRMVTHESQRQATVSRRTASTSLTVSMGNASSTSSVERPAARYRWIVSTGTRVPASSGLLPSAPRRRSTFPTRA